MMWMLDARKWRWVFLTLVGVALLLMPNFLIPRVATLNPANHSQTLMLRWLLALGALVAWFGRRAMRSAALGTVELAILAFVGVGGVSIICSPLRGYSCVESWHLVLLPLLGVALSRFSPSIHERDKLIMLLGAGGVLAAGYGFSVYWGFDFLRPFYPFAYSEADARNYIHSFLGNPEYFGGYMAPLAVVAFGQAFRAERGARWRTAWFVCCFVYLLALVLSGTRGALLGTALGMGLVARQVLRGQSGSVRRRARHAIIWLIAAAAVGVTLFSFPNPLNVRRMRLAQRFVAAFDLASDSVRERILFFSVASRITVDHPVLGVGPGCFKLHFYPYVEKLVQEDTRAGFRHFAETLQGRLAEHAHNDYLEFLSETGVLGFAALAAVVTTLIMTCVRRRAPITAAEGSAVPAIAQHQALVAFAAVACLLFNALFSFPLHLPVRATVFWVLVGLFLSATHQVDAAKPAVPLAMGATEAESH